MTQFEKIKLLAAIAASGNDSKKIETIKAHVNPNMVVYRYRPFGSDEKRRRQEIVSLKKLAPWSSRLDMLDDQLEGITSNAGRNDLPIILSKLKKCNNSYQNLGQSLKSALSKKEQRELIRKFNTSKNPMGNLKYQDTRQKSLEKGLRSFRNNFSVVCFSENSPLRDNNLWEEYAQSQGFCIEYSLYDILGAGYIIAPVYYTNERSISGLNTAFNNESYIFLTKTKDGKNKLTGEAADWEHQNEWRIISRLPPGKIGDYLEKEIIPQRIFALNIPHEEELKDAITEINRTRGLHIAYSTIEHPRF